jgi:hypothetical protein
MTLGFLTDELEEAGCVLERGQAPWRAAGTAGLRQAATGRNGARCTDDAAESKRAKPACPTVIVHATILRCG